VNPLLDPTFPDILINHLIRNPLVWVKPREIWEDDGDGLLKDAAHEVVDWGRRCGLVIDGDRAHGYRYSGWSADQARYQRRAGVAWPPTALQLTMEEESA